MSTAPAPGNNNRPQTPLVVSADWPFIAGLSLLGGSYIVLLVLMVVAEFSFASTSEMVRLLKSPDIQFSIRLTLLSCTISAVLSVWVAVPVGYLMSRFSFPGKGMVEAVLDIPIVLPPLIIGCCLLILFNYPPFSWMSDAVVFEWPAVVLAQFVVACAFAVRTMRVSFDQIPTRYEDVALTLGCNRGQAFWRVVMPQARRGIVAALTLAWARSLGEFGPILVFAGSTPMRTEVLSTSFFLEMQSGNLRGMVAISIIMISCAVVVLAMARLFGLRRADL